MTPAGRDALIATPTPVTAGDGVRQPQRFALVVVSLLIASVAIALWTHGRLEEILKPQLRAVLRTTLGSATTSVRRWIATGEQAANAAAMDPRFASTLAACVREAACDVQALHDGLLPYARTAGFIEAFVLDSEGQLRAAFAFVPVDFARGA